jgi:predicted nucleotidyltransferase
LFCNRVEKFERKIMTKWSQQAEMKEYLKSLEKQEYRRVSFVHRRERTENYEIINFTG